VESGEFESEGFELTQLLDYILKHADSDGDIGASSLLGIVAKWQENQSDAKALIVALELDELIYFRGPYCRLTTASINLLKFGNVERYL